MCLTYASHEYGICGDEYKGRKWRRRGFRGLVLRSSLYKFVQAASSDANKLLAGHRCGITLQGVASAPARYVSDPMWMTLNWMKL
mgnify:CR=1 FL=1